MRVSVVRQTVVNAPDLQPLRQALDGLDDALIRLLTTRAALSRQAQLAKVRAGRPVLDPEREAEIASAAESA